MTTHSYRPLQGDTLLFFRDFPEVFNMIRSIVPLRFLVLCALHELAAVRPHVRGTRETTECPISPPAVGSSTAGSEGRPGRLSGLAAVSAPAQTAFIVNRVCKAATGANTAPSSSDGRHWWVAVQNCSRVLFKSHNHCGRRISLGLS